MEHPEDLNPQSNDPDILVESSIQQLKDEIELHKYDPHRIYTIIEKVSLNAFFSSLSVF